MFIDSLNMRKFIVSEFVTLDGVIEDPKWSFQFPSEDTQKFKLDEMIASDTRDSEIKSKSPKS